MRARLASFLPRKIRESGVAYSSWIWENERPNSGSSHIHDNSEFRYDIQRVFAFSPSVLIPNAKKSRGPRFDSAARRARMPYRVLLGRHKEYKKDEIREITFNCEIKYLQHCTDSTESYILLFIISMIFTSVQNGAEHRYFIATPRMHTRLPIQSAMQSL